MPEYAAEHPKTEPGAAARGQRLGGPAISSGTQEFLTGANVLLDCALYSVCIATVPSLLGLQKMR